MSREKIAIIGDRGIPARYSGFSTLVEQLAVRLVRDHAMNVTVYCRTHYYEEHPPEFRGVQCVYLPAPGGKSLESIVHSNLAILHAAARDYDLAFVVDPGNAPYSFPLSLRRRPTVFHTDGLGWKRAKWSPMQKRYYKWAERVCARVATWLVTDSRAIQQYYIDEYGAPSSFIPYSGQVDTPPNTDALARIGVEPQGYFLAVARLEPENNVDHIVREYKRAGVSRPLVIVGGAQYESEYSRQVFAESNDRVKCVGSIYDSAELTGLYTHCYAYVHGHEVGGTNPSLLRAMQAGAASVPIDVVFHREVMGDDAVYFTKDDGNLAALLGKLEADPGLVAMLSRLAEERATTMYRWDAVAEAYARVFRQVLESKRMGVASAELLRDEEVYRPAEFAARRRT